MNLVTIDTAPGNMSMYIAPTNTKYLEIGKNASSVVIGPVSQTGIINVSTVINGVRIDSHTSNNNLLVSFGNTSYKVTRDQGNFCNTAVSNWAFKTNPMTGTHCTAVGHNTLTSNSTGTYNTAIGADTLQWVTTGSCNTALGGMALSSAATNSSNVAIGFNALATSVTTTHPNVAVGTGALQNFNNINIGGGGNTAIGHNALAGLTTGTGNLAVGYIADNLAGSGSINTVGNDNTIIGNSATSSGYSNTIVIGKGAQANANNQIILGPSDGSHTTWIQGSGGLSLNGPTSTNNKIIINETSGTVGDATSGSLTIDHQDSKGASSIIFPSRTNRGSDHAYIRYRESVDGGEKSRLEIGNHNNSDHHLILQNELGLVGIGTNDPSHKLHVSGNACVSGNIGIGTTDVTRPLTVNGLVTIGDGAFNNDGYATVHITSTDRNYFQLALIRAGKVAWRLGTVGANNDFIISAHFSSGGVKLTDDATAWASRSDRNLKTNFEDIEEPIKKINNIKGCYYKFKKDTSDSMRRVGVIAQDIQSVLPEVVSESIEDGQNILSVKYTELIPLLIEGIKSQQSHIEDLKSRLSLIEARLAGI